MNKYKLLCEDYSDRTKSINDTYEIKFKDYHSSFTKLDTINKDLSEELQLKERDYRQLLDKMQIDYKQQISELENSNKEA